MRYKFIVNPAAGGGKAVKLVPLLLKRFRKTGVDFDVHTTSAPGEAVFAAQKAVAEGFGVVVAVGGDGTVNEVANGLAGSEAVLATVPAGKGNDFALAVNMPATVEASCQALLRREVKAIDLGRVLDRYFVNSVGAGFAGEVARRANPRALFLRRGMWPYIVSFLKTSFSYRPVEMEITLDDLSLNGRFLMVAVGIGPSCGGGMKILPVALQDDGYFDICTIGEMGMAELVYHFPKVLSGTHLKLKQVSLYRSREIKMQFGKALPLQVEGEVLFGDKLHFTLQPKGIKVLVGSPVNLFIKRA